MILIGILCSHYFFLFTSSPLHYTSFFLPHKKAFSAMKIITNFPKKLFNKYKNSSLSRSVSRSEHPLSSFNSTATESSSSSSPSSKKATKKINGVATPTSVLPSTPPSEASPDEWSDISAEVVFEIQQAFKLIDSDGDGKITRDELAAFLSRVGKEPPTSEEMSILLREVDRNGDGCIGLQEFGAISSAFGPPACDSELKEAFDFFDADHDGQITAEELYNVFRELGDSRCTLEDCRSMINGVDKNGDGFVCFADFCRMMDLHR